MLIYLCAFLCELRALFGEKQTAEDAEVRKEYILTF